MVGKPHRLAFWTTTTCSDIFFDWQYCISGEVKYGISYASSNKVVAEGILAKKILFWAQYGFCKLYYGLYECE